jgi:UDP-N-acetylmuramate dehydrogenase
MTKPPGLQEKVALAPLTTMRVGGPADFLVPVRSESDVAAACEWAATQKLPVFVLGEGSNVVVSDDPVHQLVLKMEVSGFETVAEDNDTATMKIGAGEHWDDAVKRTVELGLAGIEAMSMIPGTAGGAPVQNAGAYGQEIADTLIEVRAYDLRGNKFVDLPREECGLAYRTSKFRGEWAGRFVITSFVLRLSKRPPQPPAYESLKRYLDEQGISNPSLQQIRDGVMAVRARVLPDPSVVPNTGSFFKNPIVSKEKLGQLEQQFNHVVSFPYGDQYKIGAGWILEQCGFTKGLERDGLAIWKGHALVITNPHHASYADLMKLVNEIKAAALERLSVELEMEPLLVT